MIATFLIATAALFWLGIPLALVVWWLIESRRENTWQAERPTVPTPRRRSDLSSGLGWARESTPIHDRLLCEQIEKREGWVA